MNDLKKVPSVAEINEKRRQWFTAVDALFSTVIEAIEASATSDKPIEVPYDGISDDIVNAVIMRFGDTDWVLSRKNGAAIISVDAKLEEENATPRPPRPPYFPPQPVIPTPPVQPIFEPGNTPPHHGPVPTPPSFPPAIPPGSEPMPPAGNPPGTTP